jgi:hypothetical protein
MSMAALQKHAAEHFIMSFGANFQLEEDTHWMSEYDGIERFNKTALTGSKTTGDDNDLESTAAGSAANSLVDMRSSSSSLGLQTSRSQDFWHFYRSADSLVDMHCLQTTRWQDDVSSTDLKTFRWDRPSECDWWKLPLEPSDDELEEEAIPTKSQQDEILHVQSRQNFKSRLSSRGCLGKRIFARATRGSEVDTCDPDVYRILAEQIY